MKTLTYLEDKRDLDLIKKLSIDEVIISTSRLSVNSKLSLNESMELAKLCLNENISAVLEWDILMTENEFISVKELIEKIDLSLFKAIRVRDPGAIRYIYESHPHLLIQLNLENGNHNLEGILRWCQYLNNRLDRLILSIEISKDQLDKYRKELLYDIEVLGIGRIPLFYSPRALLSHAFDEKPQMREIYAQASSEESPHRGFDLEENIHGTMMYNPKDYGPILEWDELKKINSMFLRLDFRHLKSIKSNKDIKDKNLHDTLLSKSIELLNLKTIDRDQVLKFKEIYPRPLIKGFYKINRSNILFKKLKNRRTMRSDKDYLGEVIEVHKGVHLGIHLLGKNLKFGDHIKLFTPDGKEKTSIIKKMTNSKLENIKLSTKGEIVFIGHLGGVSIKTQVYKNNPIESLE